MNTYRRSLLALVIFVIVLETVVVIAGDITRPPWGDEYRLLETVRQFDERFDLDRLKHYEQLSGPLPFVVYAAWGKLVGFDLWRLRLLSLIVALLLYVLFHRLAYNQTGSGRLAFLTAAFLAIHPYMVGFSLFVFTDGLTILFLVIGLAGLAGRRALWLAVGLGGALLCRQYSVFFAGSALVYLLRSFIWQRDRNVIRLLGGWVIGMLPAATLFLFWGGISPDNKWRAFYQTGDMTWHVSFFVLYVALLALYLLPFVAARGRTLFRGRTLLVLCGLLSLTYWLFPVAPSPYAEAINVHTVGLFHKAMVWLVPGEWFAAGVFFLSYAVGLVVLAAVVRSTLDHVRHRRISMLFLYDLTILAFLLVMPMSYLNWEKYFMPLVPFIALRLLPATPDSDDSGSQATRSAS